jgi:hypothetical protein
MKMDSKLISSEESIIKKFKINRNLPHGEYLFNEIFSGIETSPALRLLFKDKEFSELQSLKVEITSKVFYMKVHDIDEKLLINSRYLRRGRKEFIYLDLIHEFTHIKQRREGLNLFDDRYSYVDRPTELVAYANAVNEARRLGLSELEIYDYIWVDWISDSELQTLAKRLDLKPPN